MKKLICAILLLLVCTTAFAQGIDLNAMPTADLDKLVSEAKSILDNRRDGFTTLDEYIERHNAAMRALSYDTDSYICRAHIPLENGEANDTFVFSIYGEEHAFIMLRIEKETENIIDAVAFLSHTGYEYKQPKRLFEYTASLAYGTGFLSSDDYSGVLYLEQDLGLYKTNAFAFGVSSTVMNEAGNMNFSYSCDEALDGIIFTVSAIK